MESVFKKIELYSTCNFEEDKEKLEKERKTIEDLLTLNELEYKMMVEENPIENSENSKMKYTLYVSVKEEEFDNVIELFDEFGYLGYSINSEEEGENEASENTIEIEESINKKQSENLNKEESNKSSDSINLNLTKLITIGIAIILFIVILILEVSFISNYLKQGNLGAVIGMAIIIVCEFPMLVSIIKKIINKEGK